RRALPAPSRPERDFAEFAAARDALDLDLIALWQTLFGVQPIGIRDNFFALGGHSLLAVRLLAAIQERFRREVPLSALFQHGTIEGLASLLTESSAATPFSPLVPLQETGAPPVLFCIHNAGGGLEGYRRLISYLGPEQPVYGFRARGLERGEEPLEGVEEMAKANIAALRRFQPRGPYHLIGWSFGSLVAFEMARRLRAQGEAVPLLVLGDPRDPGPSTTMQDADEVLVLAFFASEAGLAVEEQELRQLAGEERLAHLVDRAREAGLISAEIGLATGIEYLRRLVSVFQASWRAARDYVPGPYAGPVTIFRAAETMQGAPNEVGDGGWGAYCSTPPALYRVPGNHQSLLREPNVQTSAAVLRELLRQRRGNGAP
ncbi:MAG TPA: thioesterase domain-containing protein, partial [Thermoanaerobaculia bacterium]|nr:thioesterase domain-containing protein [Thermoanaerobaculia bacterium]